MINPARALALDSPAPLAFPFAEPPAGITEIEAAAVLVFDVPFPRPGQYRFEITVDGERKATVPITVSQMPVAPVQPPPSTPQTPSS